MNTSIPIAAPTDVLSTYAYSYPHKSSYRPLDPAVQIADAWRDEDVQRLSLYVHVPFCEMRCGFCNLFTQSQPAEEIVAAYLATLRRQMSVIHAAVPRARFSQLAIGGGTPTFLAAQDLETLLRQIETIFSLAIRIAPTSIETSPATATPDRLRVLRDFGIERISLGVQSFIADETRHIGRPQQSAEAHQALESIRASGIPVLNVDLIYGDPQQSRESWLASIREALRYRPEELYLYPLYVRPNTGLAKAGAAAAGVRADLYRAGRDFLLENGYLQASLRCFRLPRGGRSSTYGCQRDGMIGLGCGARSYTERLHYATRFATTQSGIRAILREWIAQPDAALALATHGVWLTRDEQLRRYVLLSLLQAEGLSRVEFRQRFPDLSVDDVYDFDDLVARGWLAASDERYTLTATGLELSDSIAPMLYSSEVRERLWAFVEPNALAGDVQ